MKTIAAHANVTSVGIAQSQTLGSHDGMTSELFVLKFNMSAIGVTPEQLYNVTQGDVKDTDPIRMRQISDLLNNYFKMLSSSSSSSPSPAFSLQDSTETESSLQMDDLQIMSGYSFSESSSADAASCSSVSCPDSISDEDDYLGAGAIAGINIAVSVVSALFMYTYMMRSGLYSASRPKLIIGDSQINPMAITAEHNSI